MTKTWNTAIYIRLSQDDKDKLVSNSVVNQTALLKEFVDNDEELSLTTIEVDDGYTGTNFARPGFIKMMKAVKAGKIDCIVVKDLSRFAREYIDTGNYLERIFPSMGVRFISLLDRIDSFKNPKKMNSIEIPFLNLINEEYARDISRKTRSSLDTKRKQGQFTGNCVPYGYVRNPINYAHLIIDENTSKYAEMIFKRYIQGMSPIEIAKTLNSQNIETPVVYRVRVGIDIKRKNSKEDSMNIWTSTHVRNILKNPLYTGDMVQGTTYTENHKVKKRKPKPKDEWAIVLSTHEAIISHDMYNTVNKMLQKGSKPRKNIKSSILSRYVICGDCGSYMVRKTSTKNGISYRSFVCSKSKINGKDKCTSHVIGEDILLKIVFDCIKLQIDSFVDAKNVAEKLKLEKQYSNQYLQAKSKLNNIELELNNTRKLKSGLYEDMIASIITYDEYKNMLVIYSNQIEELVASFSIVKSNFEDLSKENLGFDELLMKVKDYQNFKKLTHEIMYALVEKIIVYENKEITVNLKISLKKEP